LVIPDLAANIIILSYITYSPCSPMSFRFCSLELASITSVSTYMYAPRGSRGSTTTRGRCGRP